jgi:hypothetical protein
MYILKLLLNEITARTEALVTSGDNFLCACVKEVCCLWAQPCLDIFRQLLIIVQVLWSQPVLQAGKLVVVAQSLIRAVRRVVNQVPAAMLQWCWSASQLHADAHHHGGALHWHYSITHLLFWMAGPKQFLVFHNTLLTLLWFLVAWIPPSALLFSPRKVIISFLADVYLNLFRLSGECVHIHCFDCSLVSTFTNKTQVSSPVTCIMWLRNSSPSL